MKINLNGARVRLGYAIAMLITVLTASFFGTANTPAAAAPPVPQAPPAPAAAPIVEQVTLKAMTPLEVAAADALAAALAAPMLAGTGTAYCGTLSGPCGYSTTWVTSSLNGCSFSMRAVSRKSVDLRVNNIYCEFIKITAYSYNTQGKKEYNAYDPRNGDVYRVTVQYPDFCYVWIQGYDSAFRTRDRVYYRNPITPGAQPYIV